MDADEFRHLTRVQRYILAILGDLEGRELGDHLRLQKALYLLGRQNPALASECEFEPHYQGPFSEQAENSAADLQAVGALEQTEYKTRIRLPHKQVPNIKRLLEDTMPSEKRNQVRRLNQFLDGVSNDELLLIVYHDDPVIGGASVVREEVHKRRLELALSLYRKGKITLSRAAELAGMSLGEIQPLAPKRRPTRRRSRKETRFSLEG